MEEQKKSDAHVFNFDYEHTVIYGRYRESLASYARELSTSLSSSQTPSSSLKKANPTDRNLSRLRIDSVAVDLFPKLKLKASKEPALKCFAHGCKNVWSGFTIERLGEDWIFLALLGISMAIISFGMEFCTEKCLALRNWLMEVTSHVQFEATPWAAIALEYFVWTGFALLLTLLASAVMHMVSSHAIGSGIPEVKTIMRGIILKEYLSFSTLIAKIVGLTLVLGSGIPVGREGPSVHIASIVSTLLSKLVKSFKGIYENESRSSEMLAAACAVGVACTFGAPVGGVLFSIEVTSVYFAVRNYWRGFFAAACSAVAVRLLAVWLKREALMVVAFYKTSFSVHVPFDPLELIPFCLIGVVCGFGSIGFIKLHRFIVTFMRNNSCAKALFGQNRLLYPVMVVLLIVSVTFPLGAGQYFASNIPKRDVVLDFFSNFSWTLNCEKNIAELLPSEQQAMKDWGATVPMIYLSLCLFAFNMFWMAALAITLPLPTGVFIPLLIIGASFGRIVGEGMAQLFPTGIHFLSDADHIVPGAYAVVVSVSVIIFEMTGQLVYIVPIMLAVLISNAVSSCFESSIYDSIIKMKHLPYLPEIIPTSSVVHKIFVEEFMVTNLKYISYQVTYDELRSLLLKNPLLPVFPLVDNPTSMILLGSVPRAQLELALDNQIGDRQRRREAWSCYFRKASFIPTNDSGTLPLPRPSIIQSLGYTSNKRHLAVHQALRRTSSDLSPASIVPGIEKDPDNSNLTDQGRRKSLFSSDSNVHAPAVQHDSLTATLGRYFSQLTKKLRHSTDDVSAADADVDENAELKRIDLYGDVRKNWEQQRLNKTVDFNEIHIDPSPFQLVERTSLFKVHSLFSMLGMNRAYVTALGKLIGVVSLREALEQAHIGLSLFSPASTPFTSNDLVGAPAAPSVKDEPLEVDGQRYLYPLSAEFSDFGITTVPEAFEGIEESGSAQFDENRPKTVSFALDQNSASIFVPEIRIDVTDNRTSSASSSPFTGSNFDDDNAFYVKSPNASP